MTAPAKTTTTTTKTNHETQASAPVTWRQVQEAQKKVDRTLTELKGAMERYGAAEAELALASDRLDRALSHKDDAQVKP